MCEKRRERSLRTAFACAKTGESFCQLVGKVEQLESELLSCLPVCVSASTTALFWVELDLCICSVSTGSLGRLGARKREGS